MSSRSVLSLGTLLAATIWLCGFESGNAQEFGIPESCAPYVAKPAKTFDVWPDLPPGGIPEGIGDEVWKLNEGGINPVFVSNVSKPELAFYPAEDPNGACVMVFPGGSYSTLAINYEGTEIAQWFNKVGVSVFVLKYRVPSREGWLWYWAAFQDAQRSIRLIRAHAEELKIDVNKIGVIGFSAGAHLAIAMANQFETQSYDAIDDVDKLDVKPNFAVPVYPGYLIEDRDSLEEMKLSDKIYISPDAPPHFIAVASDDRNRGFASAVFYCELKRKGVLAELHIPLTGGHGFGIRSEYGYAAEWIENCEKWLRVIKMVP